MCWLSILIQNGSERVEMRSSLFDARGYGIEIMTGPYVLRVNSLATSNYQR